MMFLRQLCEALKLVVRLSKVFVRVSQDLYKSVFEN